MRITPEFFRRTAIISMFLLLSANGLTAQSKDRIIIQANAMGTSTQLGKLIPVKIIIEEVSTPDDQQALIDGFSRSGHTGMLDALTRMRPKGRVSLEGRVGNDVKYIRELPS